jgi:RNA-directed DNA polymerase
MDKESSLSIKTPLLSAVGGFANDNYWSSSENENNTNNAWNQNFNNGNQNNNNKDNNNYVRCVRDFKQYLHCGPDEKLSGLFIMQLKLFPEEDITASIPIEELFHAYISCRRLKRNTANAIAFEVDYESNLIRLCEEINNGTYHPGRSIAFIVDRPVKREIFAADFRDRVVHHLIINRLNPLFEKEFIYDSYACRVAKGTLFGIRRIDRFIRQCSRNYTEDCYVLKLDIKGFFMCINKKLLFEKLKAFIEDKYKEQDKDFVIDLCRKVIFYDPTKGCIIKGNKKNWQGLPFDKSLFCSPKDCGLPIGNLTSQVFANFYMNPFDHFIKHDLGIRFYGRYVDDFVIVHADREYLKSLIPIVKDYLELKLNLTLHPKKIYLQHYAKGIKYLGSVIKPHRTYIANRTKGNFYQAIERQNLVARDHKPTKKEKEHFLSSMNSYLGIMKHHKTFFLRRDVITRNLSGWWWNYVYLNDGVNKFSLRQKKE